ncbi:MAG: hypothetical protein OXC07_01980 [Kistimonas sp.]|nr:hypothetical protein [Kistimonas sp.]
MNTGVEVERPPSRPAVITLALLEKVLGSVIRKNPSVVPALEKLDGRQVQFSSSAPRLEISVCLGTTPVLSLECAQHPDARLAGTSAGLLALLLRSAPLDHLPAHGVVPSGDLALLGEMFAILARLDRDLEEKLAPYTGGLAAHLTNAALTRGLHFARRCAGSLHNWLPDYLQEEAQVLAAPGAVEAFAEDLDALRRRLADAHLRMEQLEPHRRRGGSVAKKGK